MDKIDGNFEINSRDMDESDISSDSIIYGSKSSFSERIDFLFNMNSQPDPFILLLTTIAGYFFIPLLGLPFMSGTDNLYILTSYLFGVGTLSVIIILYVVTSFFYVNYSELYIISEGGFYNLISRDGVVYEISESFDFHNIDEFTVSKDDIYISTKDNNFNIDISSEEDITDIQDLVYSI
jgi:hypothetical protein